MLSEPKRFDLLFENFCKISAFKPEIFDPFTPRQRTPSRHVLFGRGAYKTEDELCLVEVAAARQDRFAFEHFAKDTSGLVRLVNLKAQGRLTQLPTCRWLLCTVAVEEVVQVGGTTL